MENHNVEGLLKAIEDMDVNTAMDIRHLKIGRKKNMRLFLKENER